jgi:hypothetical protein
MAYWVVFSASKDKYRPTNDVSEESAASFFLSNIDWTSHLPRPQSKISINPLKPEIHVNKNSVPTYKKTYRVAIIVTN